MKAILLAAGLGTRLLPLTLELPKCLMPIHGRPLLEYWLRALRAAQVEDILVNTHYLPEMVRGFVEASPWSGQTKIVFEPELLGTAGTLLANRDFAAGGPVMLVHADNLCGADLAAFIQAHAQREAGVCMTMMSFLTENPQSCGILELNAAGLVQGFHEKVANPPGRNANAAVYIVEPEVTEFAASLGCEVVDFSTEIIPHFLGRIQAWQNCAYHRDIGTVQSLLAAQIEYPEPGQRPGSGPDFWSGLCTAKDWDLVGRLASSLATALKLPETRDLAAALSGPALLRLTGPDELDSVLTSGQATPASGSVLVLDQAAPQGKARGQALCQRGWQFLTLCAAPPYL